MGSFYDRKGLRCKYCRVPKDNEFRQRPPATKSYNPAEQNKNYQVRKK
jgi:hypothetical protein